MKNLLWIFGFSLLLLARPALAGSDEEATTYAGLLVGHLNVRAQGYTDGTAFGAFLGHEFDEASVDGIGNFGIEAEYVQSTVDLTVTGGGYSETFEVDYRNIAAFATFRTSRDYGPLYFKLKAGFNRQFLDVDDVVDGSESGFTAGMGGGWRIKNRAVLEAEMVVPDSDAFLFTFRAALTFQ